MGLSDSGCLEARFRCRCYNPRQFYTHLVERMDRTDRNSAEFEGNSPLNAGPLDLVAQVLESALEREPGQRAKEEALGALSMGNSAIRRSLLFNSGS